MKTPSPKTSSELDRLERVLAHQGIASRREAKKLITDRKVQVNGKTITEPGYQVGPSDTIKLTTDIRTGKETILVYKPRGIETSATSARSKDLHALLPRFAHLSPIGRLDKDSEGLIIMSNDGTLTNALTKIGSSIGKTYLVTTREPISESSLRKMTNGIALDGVLTKPAETTRVSRTSFTITLHEGRKHQIRRMCDACRLTITSLIRIKIGHLKIGTLTPGSHRALSAKDIALLKA